MKKKLTLTSRPTGCSRQDSWFLATGCPNTIVNIVEKCKAVKLDAFLVKDAGVFSDLSRRIRFSVTGDRDATPEQVKSALSAFLEQHAILFWDMSFFRKDGENNGSFSVETREEVSNFFSKSINFDQVEGNKYSIQISGYNFTFPWIHYRPASHPYESGFILNSALLYQQSDSNLIDILGVNPPEKILREASTDGTSGQIFMIFKSFADCIFWQSRPVMVLSREYILAPTPYIADTRETVRLSKSKPVEKMSSDSKIKSVSNRLSRLEENISVSSQKFNNRLEEIEQKQIQTDAKVAVLTNVQIQQLQILGHTQQLNSLRQNLSALQNTKVQYLVDAKPIPQDLEAAIMDIGIQIKQQNEECNSSIQITGNLLTPLTQFQPTTKTIEPPSKKRKTTSPLATTEPIDAFGPEEDESPMQTDSIPAVPQ